MLTVSIITLFVSRSSSTYKHIGNEHAVEVALLQQLGKLDPVLDVVEVRRPVTGMPPEAGGLMAATRFDKGVDDQLLLGARAGARCTIARLRCG